MTEINTSNFYVALFSWSRGTSSRAHQAVREQVKRNRPSDQLEGAGRGNPCTHREKMQTHKKAPRGKPGLKQATFHYEERVITTTPDLFGADLLQGKICCDQRGEIATLSLAVAQNLSSSVVQWAGFTDYLCGSHRAAHTEMIFSPCQKYQDCSITTPPSVTAVTSYILSSCIERIIALFSPRGRFVVLLASFTNRAPPNPNQSSHFTVLNRM